MKKVNIDNFNLLKSEIKKAERCANNHSGYTDCKVTAYSVHFDRPFDVTLTIPMFDRRRTTANIRL